MNGESRSVERGSHETVSVPPELSGTELCVFKAEWPPVREFVTTFERWLSPDESSRAARTSHIHVRERFVLSRGIVRLFLGWYARCDPARVDIVLESSGKPVLGPSHGRDRIQWNVSHSHESVVLALARDRRVGIDLEYLHRPMHVSEISHRFFHPDEAARLEAIPEGSRPEAFFRYWTAKEAVLKAMGLGLSGVLNRCVVDYQPGAAGAVVQYTENEHTTPWQVAYLTPYPRYLAAISAEGEEWTHRCVDASPALLHGMVVSLRAGNQDGPDTESRRPRKND